MAIVFAHGDGQDKINNYDTDSSEGIVKFTNVASTDVTGIFEFNEGVVLQYGGGDQIIVSNYYSNVNGNYRVSQFWFTDTTWFLADIALRHNGTSLNDDSLNGFNGVSNVIHGLGGSDILNGGTGDDALSGDSGCGYAEGRGG